MHLLSISLTIASVFAIPSPIDSAEGAVPWFGEGQSYVLQNSQNQYDPMYIPPSIQIHSTEDVESRLSQHDQNQNQNQYTQYPASYQTGQQYEYAMGKQDGEISPYDASYLASLKGGMPPYNPSFPVVDQGYLVPVWVDEDGEYPNNGQYQWVDPAMQSNSWTK